jgi:peptide/nickel transport system substrate-binding protein
MSRLRVALAPQIAMVAAVALSFALTPAMAAETPKHGGTLIFGGETEWGFLDPHIDASGATHRVNYQLFEGLVWRDYTKPNDGSPPPIVPQLATSFEISDDGTEYTFQLREGVEFHDGTPFNAGAVEFNVRRVWDEDFEYFYDRAGSLKGAVWKELKDIQIVDDHTIKFILKQPWAFFIAQLAEPTGVGIPVYMSPASIMKWGNEEVEQHPVGTGPFKFAERVRGQRIVYERNPDYWNQPFPYLDRIIWRPIPEASTRVNALVGGEVDMIAAVPPDNAETLAGEGFTVATGTVPHIWWLNLNHNELPFSDVNVRKAVNYGIDRVGMTELLLRETALPAFSMISRTSSAFDPNWKDPYPYDPELAKEFLAKAGYPDGFETTLQTSTAGSGQLLPVQMAEWIQRDLAKIGIKAKLETFEWNTYVGHWVGGLKPGQGINQISWGTNSDVWLVQTLSATSCCNSGAIDDPVIEELLEKMQRVTDVDLRIQLARQIHVREREQAHNVPVVNDRAPFAMSPKVKGFIRAADWMEDYKIVWKEE